MLDLVWFVLGFFFNTDFGIFELRPYVWLYAALIQHLTSFKFNTLLKKLNKNLSEYVRIQKEHFSTPKNRSVNTREFYYRSRVGLFFLRYN